MSAVSQFDDLIELAQSMGYQIRFENLGGTGGGACSFGGKQIIFVDLSLSLLDQIEHLQKTLQKDRALPLVLSPRHRLDPGVSDWVK